MGWEKVSINFEKSLEAARQTTEVAQSTDAMFFVIILSVICIALILIVAFGSMIYCGDAFQKDKNEKKKVKGKLNFSPK